MTDVFVTQQPIFDARHRVVGYELLYRSDGDSDAAQGETAPPMSSSVILEGVIGFALNTLTEGQTAFIKLSENMLLQGAAQLLNRDSVVIELLDTVRPTEPVVAACRALVEDGYKLALDDFVYDPAWDPILDVAEIVKVDVIEAGASMHNQLKALARFDVKLLAGRVENKEIHDRCVAQGFSYFQGFHYFQPETLTKRDMSPQSLTIVRLLGTLQDPNATDREIAESFGSDPSLTYKLLRIVNSAALGGRGVNSIGHALRLLGRGPLHRWLCVLFMTVGADDDEIQAELVKAALLRGRMCEAVGDLVRGARPFGVPSGGSLFLVGLFSGIERVLGIPLAEVVDDVGVTEEVRLAILEHEGVGGAILTVVDAYMEADWQAVEAGLGRMGADSTSLSNIYLESLKWARDQIAFSRYEL